MTAPQRPSASLSDGTFVVRRWLVDDAADLHRMLATSVEHLRPWMPFISAEPLEVSDRADLLEGWELKWDQALEFTYAITRADGSLLGSCGLHARVEGGLEIGYWLAAGETGRGAATAAVGLLVEAAFALDHIGFVEIRHDQNNLASGRVAERSGFDRVGEEWREVAAPGESGTTVVWRRTRPG